MVDKYGALGKLMPAIAPVAAVTADAPSDWMKVEEKFVRASQGERLAVIGSMDAKFKKFAEHLKELNKILNG